MIDPPESYVPHIDKDGNIIGKITRGEAHCGSRLLHPVVHLHVFNSRHELYLQKRPEWKDIQPGKWDTSVGGHIDYGEEVEEALRREVREELGITDYTPRPLTRYIFDSVQEQEMVYVFSTVYDGVISPDPTELAGGRSWTMEEIKENIGKGILTPNFEQEFTRLFIEGKTAFSPF